MKPKSTFQTKRKAPKSSGLRILNASTGNHKRRKQRAATATADDLGEVPGVGVARALIVILLLHVLAIGGIWMHSNWSKENTLKGSPAAAAKAKDSAKPDLVPGGKYDFVESGDNYVIIARKHGVDVDALKAANGSAPLRPGLKINIPARRVESTKPSESIVGIQSSPIVEPTPPVRPISRPEIGARPLVQVESTPPSRPAESEPVLIKPRLMQDVPPPAALPVEPAAPRAVEVREDPAPAPSYRTHKVVKGNSIWGLSRKYGVSSKSLMQLNGISDPSKLRLGKTLKIPTR
ncbi:LysM peptidoglycan-binding domain-containing protein [Akkermansiaceae bacterium]|nr:LysM peptidoglycan-binding domain-containing protein [Akkermansiaceae bacterium]MDB4462054.1 LysM peptidoglycan-binding domain-containing protein [bacterium]MDB4142908.1 LysM peptidoglycan-binding domain-containing protein [Akkermansiaceae bacterium]MDB4421847.1 LysM peptidoglycan-binding domain-containing protein [Akkermansiaceae bacterium]MDB4462662.1 LysM peptidoglycan-binding domain-containing protein [Akkermansiaceae bacterium]